MRLGDRVAVLPLILVSIEHIGDTILRVRLILWRNEHPDVASIHTEERPPFSCIRTSLWYGL